MDKIKDENMANIVEQLLKCIDNTAQDGGPGSGRRKGSKNRSISNAVQTQENAYANSAKSAKAVSQKYANKPATPTTFQKREGELEGIRGKLRGTVKSTRNAIRNANKGKRSARMTPIVAVDSKKAKDDQVDKKTKLTNWSKRKEKPSYETNSFSGTIGNTKAAIRETKKGFKGKGVKPVTKSNKNIVKDNLITKGLKKLWNAATESVQDGGPGSGNFKHEGRKGIVGGSAVVGNKQNEKMLTTAEKQQVAAVLDAIGTVLKKEKGYFKNEDKWTTPKEFNDALAKVKNALKNKDVTVSHNKGYTELKLTIGLKNKKVTLNYNKDMKNKKWRSKTNVEKIGDIVTIKRKAVGDAKVSNLAQLLANTFEGGKTLNTAPDKGKTKNNARSARRVRESLDAKPNNLPETNNIVGWLMDNILGGSVEDGGPGSGNYGHKGRPGEKGGSAPSEGGSSAQPAETKAEKREREYQELSEKNRATYNEDAKNLRDQFKEEGVKMPEGWTEDDFITLTQVFDVLYQSDDYWTLKDYADNADEWSESSREYAWETDCVDAANFLERDINNWLNSESYVGIDFDGDTIAVTLHDDKRNNKDGFTHRITISDVENECPDIDDVHDIVKVLSEADKGPLHRWKHYSELSYLTYKDDSPKEKGFYELEGSYYVPSNDDKWDRHKKYYKKKEMVSGLHD